MSYVRKKIVIEAEVPDGASHYEISDSGIEWLMLEKWWSWWNYNSDKWEPIPKEYKPKDVKELEIVEWPGEGEKK